MKKKFRHVSVFGVQSQKMKDSNLRWVEGQGYKRRQRGKKAVKVKVIGSQLHMPGCLWWDG